MDKIVKNKAELYMAPWRILTCGKLTWNLNWLLF